MHTFTDNATPPRDWAVVLTIATVKRVKASIIEGGPIDLIEINQGDPPLALRLATDPVLLCDVLFCICQPQAEERGCTDSDFAQGMGGGAIFAAQVALFEELTDFFRQLGRTEKANVLIQTQRVVKATVAAANRETAKLDIETAADRAVGKLFTDARELLESRLNALPSGN
jgi:hypothetical protein